MKIGIIGSGGIGGTVGTLWAQAGHEVLFSSRHPDQLAALVEQAGPNAASASVNAAIGFAEVLLLSIPFGALPDFGREWRDAIGRKVLLETGNPSIKRDGAMAEEVFRSERGTGAWLREWFPDAGLVRAFNTVWQGTLASEAHRAPPRLGIPLASDDEEAMRIACELVVDAGFDPVVVGGLADAGRFDRGTSVFDTGMSGPAIRAALALGDGQAR
jgi:8-hydroxy-5-deazaflavin:NADPH oxidoreductase